MRVYSLVPDEISRNELQHLPEGEYILTEKVDGEHVQCLLRKGRQPIFYDMKNDETEIKNPLLLEDLIAASLDISADLVVFIRIASGNAKIVGCANPFTGKHMPITMVPQIAPNLGVWCTLIHETNNPAKILSVPAQSCYCEKLVKTMYLAKVSGDKVEKLYKVNLW